MIVRITDQAGTSGTVITHTHYIAEALTGWYPDAPEDVREAILELGPALERRDPAAADLGTFLAITAEPVHTVLVPFGDDNGDLADFLVAAARAAAGKTAAKIDGSTVVLGPTALWHLSMLSRDADCHYDGTGAIWIGGTAYPTSEAA